MLSPWLGLLLLLLGAMLLFALWGGFTIAWDAAHPPRKGFAWALATGRPGDPAAANMSSEDAELPGLDGLPCPAWRIRGHGDARSPVLLMLHGWGRSRWDSLSRLLPLLPHVGEAWLPDLPAHGEHRGRSSWVGVREPEAVAAMLHEVAARSPDRPIVVMGHSLGAGVAIRAAALAQSRGTRVAGVVALAPYVDVASPIPGRLALRGIPAWPFTQIAIAMLRAFGRRDRPLHLCAGAMTSPALVIACEGDRISPAADAERVAAAMPRATLLVLPGDRHDEPGAGDPDRCAAALAAFLGGVTRPRAEAAGTA
jgi:pimeloyl-ACP methyl ester carboxylesterase